MDYIKSAFEICYKVCQKKDSLKHTLRDYFDKYSASPNDRKTVKKLCFLFFRHQIALFNIIDDAFPIVKNNEKYILGVGLTDAYFVKSVPSDELRSSLIDLLKLNKSVLSLDTMDRLFTNLSKYPNCIPINISKESKKYLSLKYNVPLWVIELWSKHYGPKVAERLVMNTIKEPLATLRINNLKTSLKYVLDNGESKFVSGLSITNSDVIYKPYKDYRKHDFVEKGYLIPISEGVNHLVNKLHVKSDDILVIDYTNSNMYLALAESSHDNAHITLYREDDVARLQAKNNINRYGYNHIEVAAGSLQVLETYISSPKDVVVVQPVSTNFNAIREIPDFFLHLEQKDLDSIIDDEKDMLEEGARYVIDGGTLIYSIETANNKEGMMLIRSFLDLHSEFKLVEQRQTLEFDRRKTDHYFAILRKIGKKNG